jgi:hypothetical protein
MEIYSSNYCNYFYSNALQFITEFFFILENSLYLCLCFDTIRIY